MPSVVEWSCLLASAVVLSLIGPADLQTAVASTAIETRPYDRRSCLDGTATCSFKDLLKNALLYATRHRHGFDTTEAKIAGTALQAKDIEDYLFDQIRNIIGMFSLGFELPTGVTGPWTVFRSSLFNGRGKKNKNMGPMLAAGAAMIVGTLVPLAFGALFMLAGKAVMTSMLAITLSGLLGLKTMFGKSESVQAVKSLSAPVRPLHYSSEAFYEQESTGYNNKAQTAANVHESEADVLSGEANNNVPRDYFNTAKQLRTTGGGSGGGGGGGSNQPHWDGANYAKSVNNDDEFNKIASPKKND